MIEAGILLLVALALGGCTLAAWRAARGPAGSRRVAAVRFVAAGLAVLVVTLVLAWQISSSRTFQILGEIVPRVKTTTPVVALTFDDGPTPGFTGEVLDILQEHGIRATFFVTGRELEENPGEGQRIIAGGHELGNHSYSHGRMVVEDYATIRREIERTDELIRGTGYEGEIHFRAPYAKKLLVLPYYLSRTARKSIAFDVEPESYPEVAMDAERIVSHVLEQSQPGSIVLLHVMYPARQESRRALPGVIEGLRDRGYQFVTVSELLDMRNKETP